jgi:hypothetical protein
MPDRPDTTRPRRADDREVIERAAEAMWDAEGGDHRHLSWETLSDHTQANWRRRATVAYRSIVSARG